MATVADSFKLCRAQFDEILQSPKISDHNSEVSIEQWKDELGRLLIWAGNIGAQQTRQSSLDYRLRDASHIKDQVINLLHDIRELLTDLSSLLKDGEDDNAEDDVHEDDMSDMGHDTEVEQIYHEIIEAITQLYQMSMVIRAPAKHDRLIGVKKLDSEPFRHWALQHVSHKFPDADTAILERMGAAMAQQRAILKYRERHHAKLSQYLEQNDENATILSETVVSKVFMETKDTDDSMSTAGISETSYGITLLDGKNEHTSQIPPMPKASIDQQPFECPLCFYIITVRDKKSWARHVFRDLMPYVCTFQDCPTPNKLYESRRQWFYHVQHTHNFATGPDNVYTCPICKEVSMPATRFQRHVGRHLEELSLFFVPKEEGKEQDLDTDADDAVSSKISEEEMRKDDLMSLGSSLKPTMLPSVWQIRTLSESCATLYSPTFVKESDFPFYAKCTTIDRRLVSPEAMMLRNERFEEREECIIVKRPMSEREVREYINLTNEIRGMYGLYINWSELALLRNLT